MSNNNVKIWYNNKDVFNGIAPTPFVSISNDYIDFGNKWNQVTNITLEGQLTGKYLGAPSFNLLNEAAQNLYNNFSENYKSFYITENNSQIYYANNAIINTINIDQSSWYGILPFTVELSVYDNNLFQDYYGVIEPEENFSFEEEEGDILVLKHSVSAKGFNTNNKNAIQNAKEWVLSKKGNINTIFPALIKNTNLVNNRPYLLYSSQEVIDRFNGVYSWEGVYKKSLNLENPNNCLLNYSIDFNSGIEDGILTSTINGNLEGNNLNILKQEYNNLNLYNLCSTVSNQLFKEPLSNKPVSQSVSEINEENKISFASTFNNDYSDEIINNYTVDIKEDILKCLRTVNITAEISCKYGDIETKWQKVEGFYKTQFRPSDIINQEFKKEYPSNNLNPTPLTESISFDQFNAKINYSAEYSDKQVSYSADILNLTANVSYTPSIKIHVPNTSAFTPREHNIQNLQCANRASVQISVVAIAKINKSISIAESAALNELNRIKSNYTSGKPNLLLEDKLVSRNNDIKSVSLSETWTFDGEILS
jgi:hypothetical protein